MGDSDPKTIKDLKGPVLKLTNKEEMGQIFGDGSDL